VNASEQSTIRSQKIFKDLPKLSPSKSVNFAVLESLLNQHSAEIDRSSENQANRNHLTVSQSLNGHVPRSTSKTKASIEQRTPSLNNNVDKRIRESKTLTAKKSSSDAPHLKKILDKLTDQGDRLEKVLAKLENTSNKLSIYAIGHTTTPPTRSSLSTPNSDKPSKSLSQIRDLRTVKFKGIADKRVNKYN
jgi:hypothetical protein